MIKIIKKFNKGFSLVELLVSISIFLLFVSAIIDTTVGVDRQIKHASNIEKASILAGEAIEVSRNIRDNNFNNLIDGTYGISTSTGEWTFLGSSDTQEIFQRYLIISTVNDNQKKVDVNVSWSDIVSPTNYVSVSTFLTNWQKITPNAGLTVNKTVINHGKTSTVSDFAPYKVGTTTIVLASSTSFSAGTYTVSESGGSDYTTMFSGDCDSSGLVTLSPGDAKLCNITNEEKPSKIVVNKTVINHGQNKTASDFTFFVDSTPVLSGDINTFDSGIHTVSENIDPGYTSSIGGDCDSDGSVTLVPDQIKACTITNEEIAVIPTVDTPTVASVTTATAILGANVTSLGSPAVITARGTCWGTSPLPTTNCLAEGGIITGAFTQARTGFTPGTTYYYRGYATNSTGTGYSPDGVFITKSTCLASLVGTPTLYNSAGSASALILKPTGVTSGDIMFAHILHFNPIDRLGTIPAGWVQVGRHKNGNYNQALYYKVAGLSEGANYTFGLNSSSKLAITISAYRGCFNTTNPIDTFSNTEYVVNNTTYRASSLILPSYDTTVLVFPSIYNTTVRTFANPLTQGGGWIEDYDQGANTSDFSRAGYRKFIQSSGATGGIDSIGTSGSTIKHVFGVGLKPL